MKTQVLSAFIGLCLSALLVLFSDRVAAQTIYVSPGGSSSSSCSLGTPCSLERAKIVIDSLNNSMNQDLIVSLNSGTYNLTSSTFSLDGRHSGSNGYYVRFIPTDTSNPPVFSGGETIANTGWTSVGNGVFKKNVGTLRFRQLYIDGHQSIRARTPNRVENVNESAYYKVLSKNTTNKTVAIADTQIQNWNRLTNVEFVTHDHWYDYRLKVSSFTVTSGKANVSFQDPASSQYFTNISGKGWLGIAPYFFENALEFLDADDEWYLDETNGDLYYKPVGGSLTGKTIVVPRQETLVRLIGSTTSGVHHIRLEGITFQYTTWMYPSTYGFIATQGAQILPPANLPSSVSRSPGCLEMQYAHDVDIVGNTFNGMGYVGISTLKGGQNLRIQNNILRGINANGIYTDAAKTKNPTDTDVSKNILIGGNLIENYGIDYPNGMGILSYYVRGMIIEHNHVKDGRYMGIQTGGQPGGDVDSGPQDNQVRYNRVENVMRLIADGGGIYQLGHQRNSNTYENYIVGVTQKNNWMNNNSYPGAKAVPLYYDNYSAYWTVERNKLDMGHEIYIQTCSSCGLAHDITLIDGGVTNDTYVALHAGRSNLTELTTNLAAGKSTTASSSFSSSHTSDKAVDGSINTLFSTASGSTNGWWQVDLGDNYTISRVEIVARNDIDQVGFRSGYVIKGANSSDGSDAVTLSESGSVEWAYQGTWIASCRSNQNFRYIRIEKGSMNFAEVRVYGKKPETSAANPNLALNKPASALTTYSPSFTATLGNDDDDNSLFSSASVSGSTQPWWQVDLGSAYTLQRVMILPRNDIDQPAARRNFEIQASNSDTFLTYTTLASQDSESFEAGEVWDKKLTSSTPFRYIRVAKTAVESLNFAECRLFGLSGGLRVADVSNPEESMIPYVYPNPFSDGSLTIQLPPGSSEVEGIHVSDVKGETYPISWKKDQTKNQVMIKPGQLAPGLYIIQVFSAGTGRNVFKVLKQ